MKTLWNTFAFLAVVNLFVCGLFIAWLCMTGRLSMERIWSVREMLATTIIEEEAQADEEAQAAVREEIVAIEAERREDPLPPAIEQISYVRRLRQSELDRSRRLEEETEMLRGQLEQLRAEIAQQRAVFEQEKAAWEAQRDEIAGQAADAQFQQVVRLLEGMPAKQAKAMLIELLAAEKTDEAVAYLNAMKSFAASKVLREFKSDEEQAMATELLERIRTLGGAENVAGASLDATALSDND